jgi:uncharacterized membrane protein YeaQ/YmgE (transglycosylase-associated protein family)
MHILWWAIVGLIAGWATGKIMKGAGYGVLMDIIIGIAGAMLGGFLMRALGFAGEGGLIYTVIVAIVGAVILTAILRFFTRSKS